MADNVQISTPLGTVLVSTRDKGGVHLQRVLVDGYGSLLDGTKTVTSSGTPEALVGSSTPCRGALVKALFTNTGVVYIGSASSQNFPLEPGESVSIPIDDLASLKVRVTTNGEGVAYLATV